MNTEFILLSLYEAPFLTFAQTCKAIGISTQTGYNLRGQNAFPIPLLEAPIRAAVQDVAAYIDEQRELAKAKVHA
jgi:hypothetical protein